MMLSQFYAPIVGGEERVVEDLARALVRRGHEVSIATLRGPGQPNFELDRGLRIYRIDGLVQRASFVFRDADRRHAPPWSDPAVVRALRRVLDKENPEIVPAHNWLVHSFVRARQAQDARLIVSLHDYGLVCPTKRFMHVGQPCSGPARAKCISCSADHYGTIKGPPVALMSRFMSQRLLEQVDMFLPVSRAVAVSSALVENELPFEVLPNFVPESPSLDDGARSEYLDALPQEDFILFAGDLTYEKGVDTLLTAHARMRDRPPLVLIGRDERRLQLADERVHVLGLWPHDQVLAAWRRCSFAVVPSRWQEPFGIVALEAMAMGKPVVASRAGGLTDIVIDGETGLLVPPGDVDALAAAMTRLHCDARLRSTLATAAGERVAEFAAGAVVSRLESIYERVAA